MIDSRFSASRRVQLEKVKAEGLAVLALQLFRDINDVFGRLSETCNFIDLGGGWRLRYEYSEFVGFLLTCEDPAVRNVIPFGVPVCPVANCKSVIFGGISCQKHGPKPRSIPEKALFPARVWHPSEFEKTKSALSQHFKLPFHGNSPEENSVMKQLASAAKPIVLEEFDIEVRKIALSIEITLITDRIKFYSCAVKMCPFRGENQDRGSWYCDTHFEPPPKSHSEKITDTTVAKATSFEYVKRAAVREKLSGAPVNLETVPDYIQLRCLAQFLWERGSKGFSKTVVKRPITWYMTEADKGKGRKRDESKPLLAYKNDTEQPRFLCINCRGGVGTAAKRTLFCGKPHCTQAKEQAKIKKWLKDHPYGGKSSRVITMPERKKKTT